MSSWIDLHALLKIVLIGLAAGAGLPAIFAIGLRVLAPPHHGAGTAGQGAEGTVTAAPANVAAASVCFAIVLAAVGYGIYLIVAGS
jgi:hypothetical protein